MMRFVILAAPRTGSNLLCTLLNSHAEILCHHELFNPQGVFTALDFQDDAIACSPGQRDRDPIAFLGRVWETHFNHQCVGFKWTRGQNEQVLAHVLGDASIKKIVLRRRNRVKTYVSEMIAKQTEQWEVYRQHELVLPRPRVTIDHHALLQHIDHNNHRGEAKKYVHQTKLQGTDGMFMSFAQNLAGKIFRQVKFNIIFQYFKDILIACQQIATFLACLDMLSNPLLFLQGYQAVEVLLDLIIIQVIG